MFKPYNHALVASLIMGAAVAFSGVAHAQTVALNAGGTVNPLQVANPAPFGGTFVTSNSSVFDNTNAGVRLTGTLISSVYSTTSGPFGTVLNPTYDFYYQLFVSNLSSVGADSMSLSNFAPGGIAAMLEVAQDTDGGVSGETAQANSIGFTTRNGGGGGITVNFAGTSGQAPGSTSSIFVVRSNAVNFSLTGGAAILGTQGVSANTTANVLAPGSTVAPEPGSLALVATGLMGAMGMVVRRRRSAK